MPNQGSVCTDLWRATIVDKQVLKNIIATKFTDTNKGADVLEEMLEGSTEITVKPGKYMLHYSLNKGYFNDDKFGDIYLKLELIK